MYCRVGQKAKSQKSRGAGYSAVVNADTLVTMLSVRTWGQPRGQMYKLCLEIQQRTIS